MNKTDELRTARIESLVTPAELAQRHPVSAEVAAHVSASRRRIERILNGEDRRLLVVIGPCSIHDIDAAMEYARRLQGMRERYQPQLEIVMRTYFEAAHGGRLEGADLRPRPQRQLSGESRPRAGA